MNDAEEFRECLHETFTSGPGTNGMENPISITPIIASFHSNSPDDPVFAIEVLDGLTKIPEIPALVTKAPTLQHAGVSLEDILDEM